MVGRLLHLLSGSSDKAEGELAEQVEAAVRQTIARPKPTPWQNSQAEPRWRRRCAASITLQPICRRVSP
jgi:hypothetical protein